MKDQEQSTTHLKSLLDSFNKSTDLKVQATMQSSTDQLQGLSYKHDSLEKTLLKLKREQETNYSNVRDVLKQNWTQLNHKLELTESNKTGQEQLIQRRIASVEDLFETQRKELFSSMSEVERVLGKRLENVTRAIKEMAGELKIQNPLLLM